MGNRTNHYLEMQNVSYWYKGDKEKRWILQNVSYTFESGKMYAILGKSGAGKSTTLALLGRLDEPKQGGIFYDKKPIKEIRYEVYRRDIIGMIFQDYNLLPYLNGYQNIEIAMRLSKGKRVDKRSIEKYLEDVNIDNAIAERNVRRLSGGEQQRIAIARALAMDSKIILADEPTGNLDQETAQEIIEILVSMAHEAGKCVIAVTHTPELAQKSDVVLKIDKGKICNNCQNI